ncbi:MAG: MBL fold metallo-hydrolase [Actinomycetota bacterium]
MELIVLGSCGTWPHAGGATSGFLVRHDGFDLWVDAGSGTLSRLQTHEPLSEIDAVLISHGHPDHFLDLYPTYYARFYYGQGEGQLRVHGPADFFGRFEQVISEESRATVRETYDWTPVDAGQTFEVGPFRVETFEMAHIGVKALGYRIQANDEVLAYSGDTGPSDEVVKLARDADLFLCEATWQSGDELAPFHLSAEQAGEHATRAGARRLMLTHILPIRDRERSRSEAAQRFSGPVELALEDDRHEVGS